MIAKSLPDCPHEVQLAVIESLALPDLAALTLTSHGLGQLASPLLYAHIRMEWTLSCHPPVFLLLRSLLENTKLCTHVQSLNLAGIRCKLPNTLPNVVALPQLELSQAISRTGVSKDVAESWEKKIQIRVPDAVVALLVSMLPNLASLLLQANWNTESHFLGHLFRSALCSPRRDGLQHPLPTFQALKKVSLGRRNRTNEHTDDQNSADMLALLYLPNIQSLSASIDNPIDFTWPSQSPPTPSALTRLKLHRMREYGLTRVLHRLTNLQTLRYAWFYQSDIDEEVSDKVVRLDMMGSAMAQCEALIDLEITALTLPAHRYGEFELPDVTLHGSLAELSQLPQLKRLKVPWVFLAGMTMPSSPSSIGTALPRSLEHLTITRDLAGTDLSGEWEDQAMISVVEAELESGVFSTLQNLKTIHLPSLIFTDEVLQASEAELRRMSARFSIQLTIS
ncbi:hypothetical protein CEP51_008325 [Fusarium floridanum]|uniref:F-box domain-containing protein n=1 Tax=Fusarium floridanum TaxID=1325733 RepID=A0A428RLA4_9HYPO|nr:hypothetical protein CEP51_008325 [Fusarium floridanum]